MTDVAAYAMARRLSEPFAPGADSVSLTLVPTGDPGVARVAAYDFTDHLARFEHQPLPTCILVAAQDVPADVTVVLDYGPAAPNTTPLPDKARVIVPAWTLSGTSFAVPGVPRAATVRILRLSATSVPAGANAATAWRLVILLGNTARLLWVIGWEREQIRRQMARVVAQRHISQATGRSLDFIGSDLGVPRFPPLPYGFDADTIALYHLDDRPQPPQTEVTQVEDFIGRYVPPGNPGEPPGNPGEPPGNPGENVRLLARSRAPGRFGGAFVFRDPDAEIRIAGLSEMPVGPGDSFTVECFVRPDPGSPDGAVLAKHVDPAQPATAGWALSVGAFGRGVPGNVRFLVSDGTRFLELFADQTLSPDRFHHVAGVVDRAAGQVRLYLDGILVQINPTDQLGALINGEPVRIGRAGSIAFRGLVDEVRLSRVARSIFAPVLGEDDAAYRRRLAIFRNWILPTRANLEQSLNRVVGPIGGIEAPIVLDDGNATLVSGALLVPIVPVQLKSGESITAQ